MLITTGFDHQVKLAGQPFRARYYTETIGSVYDDERVLTASGNDFYLSGIFRSLDTTQGSDDQVMLEEGRIKFGDSVIYVNGSTQTTSGTRVFTLNISGTGQVFREITPGVNVPIYYGVPVFKKIYVRQLTETGSLF